MSEDNLSPQTENPYAAPELALSHSNSIAVQDTEEQTFRTFVGPKSDYYLDKWRPLDSDQGRNTGFNWAAFFLSGLWLPYRKMYAVTAILYGIILVETVAEEVVFVEILGRLEAPAALTRAIGLLVSIVCGAYGNQWYRSHARKVIADVQRQGFEQGAMLEVLSRRGGTSLGAPFAAFFLFILAAFAVLLVLEFILYPV